MPKRYGRNQRRAHKLIIEQQSRVIECLEKYVVANEKVRQLCLHGIRKLKEERTEVLILSIHLIEELQFLVKTLEEPDVQER